MKAILSLALLLLGATIPAHAACNISLDVSGGVLSVSTTPAPCAISLGGGGGGSAPAAACSFAASVAGNDLTVALKNAAGDDPSPTTACTLPFRGAKTSGATVSRSVEAQTTIIAKSGSSFGAKNAAAFRLWVTAWDDAGTVRVGLSNQLTSDGVASLPEGLGSAVACASCTNATSAGVLYSTATLTDKAATILGYVEWGAGLTTAGVFATAPTLLQPFGPGVPLPGTIIQFRAPTPAGYTGAVNLTTSWVAMGPQVSITPRSAANPVAVTWGGTLWQRQQNNIGVASAMKGGQPLGPMGEVYSETGGNLIAPVGAITFIDLPGSTAQQVYAIGVRESATSPTGGGISFPGPFGSGYISAAEIQG